jgi:hypothetical protein
MIHVRGINRYLSIHEGRHVKWNSGCDESIQLTIDTKTAENYLIRSAIATSWLSSRLNRFATKSDFTSESNVLESFLSSL